MITIEIRKCHCDIVIEALWEAIPSAQEAGIIVQPVIDLINDPSLKDPDTVYLEFKNEVWECMLDILRHHPLTNVGDFFIHHLQDLAADSALGY